MAYPIIPCERVVRNVGSGIRKNQNPVSGQSNIPADLNSSTSTGPSRLEFGAVKLVKPEDLLGIIPQIKKDPNIELYGAKTAGLIRLKLEVDKLKKSSLAYSPVIINIPDFVGLQNKDIHDILSNKIKVQGSDLSDLWREFSNIWLEKPTVKEGSLALEKLEAVQKAIREAIKGLSDAEICTLLGDDANTVSKMGTIMVRSSSEEDGDNPNAGGNESTAALGNSPDSIRSALEDVLCSYFSTKSIGQRFTGSQASIKSIGTFPNCAVLIQKFIGEKPGEEPTSGKKPLSGGVIYSQHLIAGMSSPVPQVIIKAAVGHTSYVTDSKGACSTYKIDDRGAIHSIEKIQTSRMSPQIDEKTNKVSLVSKPLKNGVSANLSNPVLDVLNTLTRELEKNYAMVLDIEFIYDPENNEISLVQCRDPRASKSSSNIIQTQEIQPRRIDTSKISSNSNDHQEMFHVYGTPVHTGDGHLFKVFSQEIDSERQIFVSDDVAAENLIKQGKGFPPFVIVKNSTEQSHGCNVLSNQGTSIIQVDEKSFGMIQQKIKAGFTSISLDPVTGILVLGKDVNTVESCVIDGYGGYPAPCVESIRKPSAKMLGYLNREIDPITKQTHASNTGVWTKI